MPQAAVLPSFNPQFSFAPKIRTSAKGHTFTMTVIRCEEGGYTTYCEGTGIVTEAESYAALIERANLIAPEIAELNGFDGPITLVFPPDPNA